MNVTPYPLCWPVGAPRLAVRIPAGNIPSVPRALREIEDAVTALRQFTGIEIRDMVLSTNYSLAERREPRDPAVAGYFSIDGRGYCICADKFQAVGSNLRAVAKVLEAVRLVANHIGRDAAMVGLGVYRRDFYQPASEAAE